MLHHAVRIRLMIILILTWILRVENWLRNCIFCKVHVCDLLWPSGSPQVTGHGVRWKAVYEFLSINNCNTKPIWHHYSDIDMQHFCNHGYIFEKCFSPKFLFAYCWPFFKLYLSQVSSSKTDWENVFFVKFMYVTICKIHVCDNLWPSRSPQTCKIFVTMVTFLKDVFHPFLWKNISFLWFGSFEIKSGISLVFTWSL